MNVIQIIPAPKPKRAVFYNPIDEKIYIEKSDIIGVVEFDDPEGSGMVANVACYLSYDSYGMYTVPQLQPNFINMIEEDEVFDAGAHKVQMDNVARFYKDMDEKLNSVDTVEIQNKGNVSFIKNLRKDPKKPEGDEE